MKNCKGSRKNNFPFSSADTSRLAAFLTRYADGDNNIIDGGGSSAAIQRSHNIYTGLSWSQSDAYGWSLGEEETVEEDLSLLFNDPDAVPGDFHLSAQSPARNACVDICDRIQAGLFPDFECGTDFDGNRRSVWDIGAFAY